MKVKELQVLLAKLGDTDEVVLLNEAAPLCGTNAITGTAIVQEPVPDAAFDAGTGVNLKSKLVLTYSTRHNDADDKKTEGDRKAWK